MPNFIKILAVNIILLVFVFVITEAASFMILKMKAHGPVQYGPMHYIEDKSEYMRPVETKNFGKKPLLIFGCSYVYGHEIKRESTLSYMLAQKTRRTVVNRAVPGEGPAFMLRQLSTPEFMKDIKEKLKDEPKYVIYVYFFGHERRNFQYIGMNGNSFAESYKIDENNNLVLNRIPEYLIPFHSLSIVKLIYLEYADAKQEDFPVVQKTFVKMMTETYNAVKKNFPHSKLVVVSLPSKQESLPEREQAEKDNYSTSWKKIEDVIGKNEIIFIDVEKTAPKIKEKEYWLSKDTTHPSEKMWDVVADILIKKLKL